MKYLLLLAAFLWPTSLLAQEPSLKGSKTAVKTAYEQAKEHDFTFLDSEEELQKFLMLGLLVELPGDYYYEVDKHVSRPYVRPEVKLFAERLARQYRRGCGGTLVVTSALRFVSETPRNGSEYSVHPTGMALDLRRPDGDCRKWLERNLLLTEERDFTEATLENHPPHFHVVVFPRDYARYVKCRNEGLCESEVEQIMAVANSLRPLRRPLASSLRPLERPLNLAEAD